MTENILNDYEENYITGWVKVYRSFINWEWFDDSKMVHLFLYFLLKANHKDNKWRGIEIKKGSFITSLDTIKRDTKLSHKVIRLRLEKLKLSGEIAVKTTNKNTLITILKYEVYQQTEEEKGKQKTNKGQTKGKQRAINKNDKEVKNEKEKINNKEFSKICQTDLQWLEVVAMQNKVKVDWLKNKIPTFDDFLIMQGEKKQSLRDYKSHFTNWLPKNMKLKKDNSPFSNMAF